jgi:hypothetical protein
VSLPLPVPLPVVPLARGSVAVLLVHDVARFAAITMIRKSKPRWVVFMRSGIIREALEEG